LGKALLALDALREAVLGADVLFAAVLREEVPRAVVLLAALRRGLADALEEPMAPRDGRFFIEVFFVGLGILAGAFP
jgi:hypothetical protein